MQKGSENSRSLKVKCLNRILGICVRACIINRNIRKRRIKRCSLMEHFDQIILNWFGHMEKTGKKKKKKKKKTGEYRLV